MKLKYCRNYHDYRALAKRRLPSPIFFYLYGCSDDEITLNRNIKAFDQYEFVPRVLTGTDKVDLTCGVLGSTLTMPFFLSPTGFQRMYTPAGELASAKAAAEQGTMFALSTLATRNIEEVAACSTGAKMFQIYVHKDEGLTKHFIDRAKAANYDAICLTVDTTVAGNRERDYKSGFTIKPNFTLRSLASFVMHPTWSFNALFRNNIEFANLSSVDDSKYAKISVHEYINEEFDMQMNWSSAEFIAKHWNGPFAIKGILSPEDAKRARDIGATAVIISNHGGRQLDYSATPLSQLESIVAAVGGDVEIIVDGGIRRGSDVIKALCLGATACSSGRLYLYALAAGGYKGVKQMLAQLNAEIERDMIMLGCQSIKDLNSAFLVE